MQNLYRYLDFPTHLDTRQNIFRLTYFYFYSWLMLLPKSATVNKMGKYGGSLWRQGGKVQTGTTSWDGKTSFFLLHKRSILRSLVQKSKAANMKGCGPPFQICRQFSPSQPALPVWTFLRRVTFTICDNSTCCNLRGKCMEIFTFAKKVSYNSRFWGVIVTRGSSP